LSLLFLLFAFRKISTPSIFASFPLAPQVNYLQSSWSQDLIVAVHHSAINEIQQENMFRSRAAGQVYLKVGFLTMEPLCRVSQSKISRSPKLALRGSITHLLFVALKRISTHFNPNSTTRYEL
jgi:hypothetical protein